MTQRVLEYSCPFVFIRGEKNPIIHPSWRFNIFGLRAGDNRAVTRVIASIRVAMCPYNYAKTKVVFY
jgi:hypothetical protein